MQYQRRVPSFCQATTHVSLECFPRELSNKVVRARLEIRGCTDVYKSEQVPHRIRPKKPAEHFPFLLTTDVLARNSKEFHSQNCIGPVQGQEPYFAVFSETWVPTQLARIHSIESIILCVNLIIYKARAAFGISSALANDLEKGKT